MNVFPDECVMTGTIRAFKADVMTQVKQQIELISTNVAIAFGCTAVVEF